MKKTQFHLLVCAAVSLLATASIPGQAQVAAPASNQTGVVYPNRTPAAVATPSGVVYPGRSPEVAAAQAPGSGSPASVAAAPVVPQPGTLLPGQVAPATAAPASQAAPPMPPLPGSTAKAKDPRELAMDDVMPKGIEGNVGEVLDRMAKFQRAATKNPNLAPRSVTRTLQITQAAGEEPISVTIAMGIPTNLVFFDSTGAQWPIAYATPGDASKFDLLMGDEGTSNLQLRAKTPDAYAGLSVTLKGNPIPISVILAAGQTTVDNRVDVRVMQRGPNALAPIVDRVMTGGSAASDAALINFLDGVPPTGAREIRTSMRSVKAWLLNDQLYLRTSDALVSPLWTDSMSSPNGVTRAYLLSNVPSVVISTEGRMVPVTISE